MVSKGKVKDEYVKYAKVGGEYANEGGQMNNWY